MIVKVAIVAIFALLIVFQPWMALIFALIWLVGKDSQNKEQVQTKDVNALFLEHKAQAFEELDRKIDAINAEFDEPDPGEKIVDTKWDKHKNFEQYDEKPKQKNHLRLVK